MHLAAPIMLHTPRGLRYRRLACVAAPIMPMHRPRGESGVHAELPAGLPPVAPIAARSRLSVRRGVDPRPAGAAAAPAWSAVDDGAFVPVPHHPRSGGGAAATSLAGASPAAAGGGVGSSAGPSPPAPPPAVVRATSRESNFSVGQLVSLPSLTSLDAPAEPPRLPEAVVGVLERQPSSTVLSRSSC